MSKQVKTPKKKTIKPLISKTGEVRSITLADMKKAVSFKTAHPEVYQQLQASRGRPKVDNPKQVISLRVDAALAARIKKYGAGYNRKAEALLAAGFME